MIREIPVSAVQSRLREVIEDAAYRLPEDYLQALNEAQKREKSSVGQSILLTLLMRRLSAY